jgi:hypothetical protein
MADRRTDALLGQDSLRSIHTLLLSPHLNLTAWRIVLSALLCADEIVWVTYQQDTRPVVIRVDQLTPQQMALVGQDKHYDVSCDGVALPTEWDCEPR